ISPFQNAEQFPDSQAWNLRPRVRGRIWIPHHARERFPLPTTEEWGEGQGEGISKERDNSMGTSPSPLPARASQGEGAEDFRDGGYQDGPRVRPTDGNRFLRGRISAS